MRRACGCNCSTGKIEREATDAKITATPSEIDLIRHQLDAVELMLEKLYGDAYGRNPESVKVRRDAADFIDHHFDKIVEQWAAATNQIWGAPAPVKGKVSQKRDLTGLSNSLIRFVRHLRDPKDIETYVYLRRHCQNGMLARANPSQFNAIHIALKQIILNHVQSIHHGHRMESVRAAIVAAVDERRLMVAQFYIESREVAIRASEQKYRNSIDRAPDPMYEIDPETGIVLGVNAAAERIMGDHDGVGHRLIDLVPPEMAELTRKHLETVVRQGWHQAQDLPLGGRYIDINSALISYGDKKYIQMILHDVTQKREMMDELLKAERLAATGTFAAGVAHEVNNPLASISSLVQSLLTGESDTTRRMTLHTILSQITRISATLKDLVNFARPTAAQPKPLQLNELIKETLRLVAYNKRFNSVTLEPQLAGDLKPVFADDNGIQQVLLNILLNAADAMQNGSGVIRVITENKKALQNGAGGRVVVKVVDNGIGIPREHLERVFDPFFTTKPAGSGVGLGLSLCQRIVLANRGTIKVESEVGKGTTVSISLPAYEATAQVAGTPAAAAATHVQ